MKLFNNLFKEITITVCNNGTWEETTILENHSLSLGAQALHYPNTVWEGVKGYKVLNKIYLFKLEDHYQRLTNSAKIMGLPIPPRQVFIDSIKKITAIYKNQIDYGIYIRPMILKTGQHLGVGKNTDHAFIVCACGMNKLPEKMLSFRVENTFNPVAKNIAVAKFAGNYGLREIGDIESWSQGCDTTLWVDNTAGFIQEFSTMNFFVINGGSIITPSLENGTILPGITRKTVLEIAKENSISYEERNIHLYELEDWCIGQKMHIFGTGTASSIKDFSSLLIGQNFLRTSQKENSLLKFLQLKIREKYTTKNEHVTVV